MAMVKNALIEALEKIDTASLVDELIARYSEAPQQVEVKYLRELYRLLRIGYQTEMKE